MRIRRGAWFLLFLAATVPAGPFAEGGRGKKSAAIQWEEGSRAPVDAWLQEDGCPARTGATQSEAITGPREVAWKMTVSGEVEGEPLAWRGKTFVVERAGTKRILHVLATATGVERYRQSFDTALPLAPCVVDGRLVARTSPRTLTGFVVGEKGLASRWTVAAKTSMGPPCMVRDEVYVVVDGVLERRTFGSPAPVWPKKGEKGAVRVEGSAALPGGKSSSSSSTVESPRPSVRGGAVFLATGRRLVEADRRDGSLRRQGSLGAEADPRASRVVVGYGDVFVFVGKRFGDRDDRQADACRFGLAEEGKFGERRAAAIPAGLAAVGADWVGIVEKGGTKPFLALVESANTDAEGSQELATAAVHAEWLKASVPPSAAGDVVFVGGRAFDAESLRILQPDPLPGISRTIPLRDLLLVVETRKQVTAWRSKRKVADAVPLRVLSTDAGDAAPDTGPDNGPDTGPDVPPAHAVVEDGRVVSGGFALDPKAQALRGTGKPGDAGSWPLASVRALLTDESPRRLLLGSRPEETAAAVAAIARAGAGADLAALVAGAVESGDAALSRRVHTAAAAHGAPEADLDRAEKAVVALEAAGGERAEGKATEVEERLAVLLGREAQVLVEAASSLPREAPLAYATALLRAAVDRSPYHSGATAWVREHLPPGLEPRALADLPDWLDFLDLHAAGSALVLGPGAKVPDDLPADVGEALASARTRWRDDLVGFLNGPLLVVSPPEHPGAIARCLTTGRVVCEALDAAFSSVGPPRSEQEVLVLHLFPNSGEYLVQAQQERGGEPGSGFGGLEKSAGHFSPSANVTRIFWPSTESADSVVGVYAHELTHHWIARRRPPRTPEDPLVDHAGGPGYWVVEGFADFVRGFDFDVAAGKAEPLNPRADYADEVASVPDAERIPWLKIFGMPQSEAYTLLGEGEIKLARRWTLGTEHRTNKGHLYYCQSAAVTAYLFLAEGGKYRKALLDYLYAHYAGGADPDQILKAVGLPPDELGSRVVRWCRTVVGSG